MILRQCILRICESLSIRGDVVYIHFQISTNRYSIFTSFHQKNVILLEKDSNLKILDASETKMLRRKLSSLFLMELIYINDKVTYYCAFGKGEAMLKKKYYHIIFCMLTFIHADARKRLYPNTFKARRNLSLRKFCIC